MNGQRFGSVAEVLAWIRANDPAFYVYVIRKPDGEPFYVGKGKGRRVAVHEEHARTKRRSKKLSVIRGIWNLGMQPIYELAVACETERAAADMEVKLIGAFGRKDKGLGTLLNLTDGGEGVSGLQHSLDSRERMRTAAERTRELRSQRMRERRNSPEFIERWKAAEAVRLANSAAAMRTEAHRAAKSEQMLKLLKENEALLERRREQLRAVRPSGQCVSRNH